MACRYMSSDDVEYEGRHTPLQKCLHFYMHCLLSVSMQSGLDMSAIMCLIVVAIILQGNQLGRFILSFALTYSVTNIPPRQINKVATSAGLQTAPSVTINNLSYERGRVITQEVGSESRASRRLYISPLVHKFTSTRISQQPHQVWTTKRLCLQSHEKETCKHRRFTSR